MHDNEEQVLQPSKSQRKRDAHALQALGEQLVALSSAQLEKLALPQDVHDAVVFAQSLHQRGARKRQLQYIGKLMRKTDAEAIATRLGELTAASLVVKRRERYIELLCEAALNRDQQAVDEFFDRYKDADRQHVRQLIRNAIRERQQDKPPKSRRILFRYLRQIMQTEPDTDDDMERPE